MLEHFEEEKDAMSESLRADLEAVYEEERDQMMKDHHEEMETLRAQHKEDVLTLRKDFELKKLQGLAAVNSGLPTLVISLILKQVIHSQLRFQYYILKNYY